MSDKPPTSDDQKTQYSPLKAEKLADDPAEPTPKRGRYKIGELIGEGGMATVRNAEDTHLGRRIAIKTMLPKVASSAEMRDRFVQEGRILAELAHPGTVPVHDAGILETGEPFYAMELVHGKTLAQILSSREPSHLHDEGALLGLVDIFERVCQTVAFAHGKGIIHRDIKPANIMIDDFGALAVMDWGIAKRIVRDNEAASTHTRADMVLGTPGFMSPEQTRSLACATEQTDVFALGVILYEILTLQRPFRGPSVAELTLDVLHHEPESPRETNPVCPRELSAICLKALAKDPRDRYRNAGELSKDLRRFREFRPVSALPPRLIDHLANWARRNRALAGGLGALLLIFMLAGTAVGYNRFERSRVMERVLQQVDDLQATLQTQQLRLDELNEQQADAGAAERVSLTYEIDRLEGDLANTLLSLRGTTWALVGFTYPQRDSKVLELACRHTLELNDTLLGMQRYALVVASVTDVLERIEENDNYLRYTREQIDRLLEQQAEGEAGLESLHGQ
jgi:serine/threonine protein kinase